MARIQRIVRDLGSFSHADEDVNVPIDVNAAVESALTMLRNELKYRARVERDLRATRLVLASAPRLGQVFLNLISNAAQALDEADSKRNLVRVRSFDEGDDVVVEISDNGPGIAPEVAAADLRVVLHHQAARDGDRPRACRSRSASCGRWAARSSSTAGPARGPPSACGCPPTERSVRGAHAGAGHRPRRTATPRRRILAVDDEALLLKAYRRMLGDAHELTTALGGHEALRMLERDARFDVVLCDLQMPEMSGMELHRRRARARSRRWPIASCSSPAARSRATRGIPRGIGAGRHPEAVPRRGPAVRSSTRIGPRQRASRPAGATSRPARA